MDRTDIAAANPLAAEDRLITLAHELSGLRGESASESELAERFAAGLGTLSGLARECGELRLSNVCKALACILARMQNGREEDATLVLSTTLGFLDTIQAGRTAGIGMKP